MTILNFAAIHRTSTVIATGCCALALLTAVEPAAAQISVSPVIMQIPVAAAPVTRTISVTNFGKTAASVRFYAGDFDQDARGENRFADPGTLPNSCAGRIRVYPDGASLLPGETQGVRIDMEPGTQSCWSAVFVETTAATATGTMVRQRIAAKVYGVRQDARVAGEVTQVALQKNHTGQKLVVTFRNLGDAPLRPEGNLEIRSLAGEVVAKAAIEAFSVLPGRERIMEVSVPAVGTPGEYIAVPVLDFGGEHLAGGQVIFEISAGDVKIAAETPVAEKRDGL